MKCIVRLRQRLLYTAPVGYMVKYCHMLNSLWIIEILAFLKEENRKILQIFFFYCLLFTDSKYELWMEVNGTNMCLRTSKCCKLHCAKNKNAPKSILLLIFDIYQSVINHPKKVNFAFIMLLLAHLLCFFALKKRCHS